MNTPALLAGSKAPAFTLACTVCSLILGTPPEQLPPVLGMPGDKTAVHAEDHQQGSEHHPTFCHLPRRASSGRGRLTRAMGLQGGLKGTARHLVEFSR